MSLVTKYVPHGLAVFMSGVFVDSLRFKFTDHPNTQTIFGKLNDWSGSIGLPGLFDHTGLFSQYVIGSIEGLAATLLLVGIHPRFRHLQAGGRWPGFWSWQGRSASTCSPRSGPTPTATEAACSWRPA
jgi:hypothetical protein